MSTRKHASKPRGTAQRPSAEHRMNTGRAPWFRRLPLLPVPVLFFLLAWFFAGVWYGDVFRAAAQYSFFAPDATLMRFVWEQPYGPLWIAGRALLALFHHPVLGGAVLALMLTLISWLTGYNLRLPARWRPLQYLSAGLYLAFLVYYGLDSYYQNETGQILGIPLCALVVLALQGAIIRSFSKKPVPALIGRPTDETRLQNGLSLLVALLAVAGPMLFSSLARPYVRITARMQHQLDQQDWEGLIQTAHDHADLSCRPMAALYAIALTQTGQIADRLFDIRYDFEEMFLHNRSGHTDTGIDFYQTDGNYYAGLLLAANRNAIEHLTLEGPTCHMLKRLTQIALLNGETEVARKYLHILNQSPFESAFVEQYTRLADNPEALEQEPATQRIRKVEPVSDAFHTQFREPQFLGYNIALLEGRSLEALHNSLAACLYTKLLPEALIRCQPLAGTALPQNAADALAIRANRTPSLLQAFPGHELNLSRYKAFLQSIKPYSSDRQKHAAELFPLYKGYYPYYYYFGNLKAPAHKNTDSTDHKGVN